MLNRFKNHINNNLYSLNKRRLLIAVSGGLDSVVLTHLCNQLNLDFALAHCNFKIRGTESDADETFVLKLAEELGKEVFLESFDTENYAKENKLSTQMAARKLRYNWFDELAEQFKFDYILTAHHAGDNLETFLINLSRGTGLDGLIGIPEINDNVVRPLLPFSREHISAYAKNNKLKWREDSSNKSTKYLRNKLRLEVIPKLKEVNPQFLQSFSKTQDFLQVSKAIVNDKIDDVSEDVITEVAENEIHFNIFKIQGLSNPKAYLYELFKNYGFTEWNDVLSLLKAQSGKLLFSKTHRLVKDREVLILTKFASQKNKAILVFEADKQVETSFGTLFVETTEQLTKSNKSTVFLDKNLLKFPLTLRKWQEGDYFYPFGMKGKKKLSKFFKEEKLSLIDKENSWLLCSQNNIVWIINKRSDNRFKVTNNTSVILKISLQK